MEVNRKAEDNFDQKINRHYAHVEFRKPPVSRKVIKIQNKLRMQSLIMFIC